MIWRFMNGHQRYSEAAIMTSCTGWDRWRRVSTACRRDSGMAILLSITTQLLTTAALGQTWAIYEPSSLKDVMSLFMIARFIGPRKRSSSVNYSKRSASKRPGISTISLFDEERRGLPPLTAWAPIFAAVLIFPGFDRRHRLIASNSWVWPSFLFVVLEATKRVLAARSRGSVSLAYLIQPRDAVQLKWSIWWPWTGSAKTRRTYRKRLHECQ